MASFAASRSFDGVNDDVDVGVVTGYYDNTLTQLTYATWFRHTNTSGSDRSISFRRTTGTGHNSFVNRNASGAWGCAYRNGADAFTELDGSIQVFSDDIWHFGAYIINGTNATIYVDGTSDGSANDVNTTNTFGTGGRVWIGITEGGGSDDWQGQIAHSQLFVGTVLTLAELEEIRWKPGSIRRGLTAYWPLWDGGTREGDYSGNNHTGDATGSTASAFGPPIKWASTAKIGAPR